MYSVGSGGSPCVRSGSTSVQSARLLGCAPETLWPSWYMTAPPVTSEPVPDVVGIVTRRYGLGGIGSMVSPGQQKRRIGAPQSATTRAPLAVSSAEPPPIATTTSQPDSRSASPQASTLSHVGSCRAISYTVAPAGTGGSGTFGSSTTNGFVRPASARICGSSAATPSPNRIRTGR